MRNLSRENFIYNCKIVLLITVVISLNSCLSLKSNLVLNRDNSGSIRINYRVDNVLVSLSEKSSYETPLNLDRDYLDNLANDNSGIELIEYSIREDENFIYYDTLLNFSSIEDLNRILPDVNQVEVTRSGDTTILTQTITQESQNIDSDSMDLFRDIFKNHTVEISIRTPGEIVSLNNGVRKNDREAIYQNSIIDILESSDSIDWSVSW